jgi:hypothetical protein
MALASTEISRQPVRDMRGGDGGMACRDRNLVEIGDEVAHGIEAREKDFRIGPIKTGSFRDGRLRERQFKAN